MEALQGCRGSSQDIYEDRVVVRGDSPVLAVVVLVGVVLLVVGKEGVQLEALLEVLHGFEATDVVEHVEVAVEVDAAADESVPVDALELEVSVVLLELEVHEEGEVDVWALDAVSILAGHHELVEVEHLGEDLHVSFSIRY
jgi:hypothetical protein